MAAPVVPVALFARRTSAPAAGSEANAAIWCETPRRRGFLRAFGAAACEAGTPPAKAVGVPDSSIEGLSSILTSDGSRSPPQVRHGSALARIPRPPDTPRRLRCASTRRRAERPTEARPARAPPATWTGGSPGGGATGAARRGRARRKRGARSRGNDAGRAARLLPARPRLRRARPRRAAHDASGVALEEGEQLGRRRS